MLLGVDVGGTFTDAVLWDGLQLHTGKAPTTPEDQSQGVLDAAREVLAKAGRAAEEVKRFAHGMTVTTNALLEGEAARAALVTTEGFEDLVELGRQNRPDLYRLCRGRPAPLVPPERRFGAPERMGPGGPVTSLSSRAADAVAARVAVCGPEAVAVSLLHSYRHPEHELRLAQALRARLPPGVSIHLSHESVGTFREYERTATTELDAALTPLLARYLARLVQRSRAAGLPAPEIMQSNGGLIDASAAAGHAAWTVLSGPAGGAAGAGFLARRLRLARVLCFDMGGTSCDICVIEDGIVQEQAEGEIAGRPVALPMLAIHTVGAGGGSIAWRDGGGALRVGPRSAGARPGPACYGRGGHQPTVTDAHLVLGHLDPRRSLAGAVRLDLAAAEAAVARLARILAMGLHDCARGILQVAEAEMVRALRVVTVERGIDPRSFTLMCFGGAGPLHAAAIATELGIGHVACPRASGVLSALGLAVGERRRDVRRSVFLSGPELTHGAMLAAAQELAGRARTALGGGGTLSTVWEVRYRGQGFELPVEAPADVGPHELRRRFERLHAARYGFADPTGEIELVSVRVAARQHGPSPELDGEPAGTVSGPERVHLPESTLIVPAGWQAETDWTGTVHLRREEEGRPP
jgi:N-methylhydantoinase A/oxoprolinase/acetone carboxylase beta subunit